MTIIIKQNMEGDIPYLEESEGWQLWIDICQTSTGQIGDVITIDKLIHYTELSKEYYIKYLPILVNPVSVWTHPKLCNFSKALAISQMILKTVFWFLKSV